MHVRDVLGARPREALRVGPDETVAAAARLIDDKRKGLAVVCAEDGALLGIISVIDINRAVARHGERGPAMAVHEVMNPDIVVCRPEDRVEKALEDMTKHGIRHLPVVETGVLLGVLNIRDLLEIRFEEAQMTVEDMQRYIHGVGYH
jgi:CBS domain-containing protein